MTVLVLLIELVDHTGAKSPNKQSEQERVCVRYG